MILEVLHESKGLPLAISDDDMMAAVKEIAREEGLLIAPEGAALWKALLQLIESRTIHHTDTILMLNTGTGYKYLENII